MSLNRLTVGIALLAWICGPAWADFQVCNKTAQTLNVAYATYYVSYLRTDASGNPGRFYESKGWRVMEPGECKQIDRSGFRRIWLLGVGKDLTTWEGANRNTRAAPFCVMERDRFAFDDGDVPGIHDSADICARNGGKLRQLREFLGQTENYTVDYVDGGAARRGDNQDPVLPPMGSPDKKPVWED